MVIRGLAKDRDSAQELILAEKVNVAGILVKKPGSQVDTGVDVSLRKSEAGYVSRGALKLEKALDEFGLDPSGMIVADVGASTGGFTDILLQRGAAKVYAIDVGYGQLAWKLQQDERVVVLDRENIRHLDCTKVPDPCDLAVIDTSFISLALVLPKVAELLKPMSPIFALVKPQFEAAKEDVAKGGVVREPAVRLAQVEKISSWALDHNFRVARRSSHGCSSISGFHP